MNWKMILSKLVEDHWGFPTPPRGIIIGGTLYCTPTRY